MNTAAFYLLYIYCGIQFQIKRRRAADANNLV